MMDSETNEFQLHYLSYNGKLDQITRLRFLAQYINKKDVAGRTALHLACAQNHIQVVKFLLNENAHVNCLDANLTTPLHWAVHNNNIDLAKMLIEKGAKIQAADSHGIQPIHLAALRGNPQVIRLIMSCSQVDGKVTDNSGISPLHLASYCGHNEALAALLEYFDINAMDNRSIHALNLAASCGHAETIQLLIKKGGIACHDTSKRWPIHWAATFGGLDVIQCVLTDTSNLIDKFKCTPLFLATTFGHDEAVCFFLKKLHYINLRSGQRAQYSILENLDGPDGVINKYFDEISSLPTTLHWAAAFCSPEIVDKLLKNGLNIEELGDMHNTPLHTAAAFGNKHVIEYLITSGAYINAMDETDTTPLHWAIVHRHIDCVRVLLERDANTYNALNWGAVSGDLDILKLLLEVTDCDINEADNSEGAPNISYSRNPLMWAATAGHEHIIDYLLDNGATTTCFDVIQWCSANGLINSMKKLLKLDVEVNEVDLSHARTALHWAAFYGNKEVVEYLLTIDGIELNIKDEEDDTPIHLAVNGQHLEVARMLIEHGAKVNERGDEGRPLFVASKCGNLEMLKILVEVGKADLKLADSYVGCAPLQAALENRHTHIVDYLYERETEIRFFMHKVAEFGTVEDLQRLMKPKDIYRLDNGGRIPLFWAVKNVNNLRYLLSLGSDINERDNMKRTPLYRAIDLKCVEAVKVLIEHGANINIHVKTHNYTPLIRAIETNNLEIFRLLVDNNADLSETDEYKCSPLHHVARQTGRASITMLNCLLSHGVEVNCFDVHDVTPLYSAVSIAHHTAYYDLNIKLLIDHGACLNTRANMNVGEYTPLSRAVSDKNYDLAKLLIGYGADVNLDVNILQRCSDLSYLKLLYSAGLRLDKVRVDFEELNNDMVEYIKHVRSHPHTLKGRCRIKCRKKLGRLYYPVLNVSQEIPKVVRQYLLFQPPWEFDEV